MRADARRMDVAHTRVPLIGGLCALAAAAFAADVVLVALGDGGSALVSTWLLVVAVGASAGCCATRAATVPTDRSAWWLLAAGMAVWAAAEVVYVLVVATQDPEPVPSVADVLWLAQYPAAAGCLALLVRARVGRVPLAFGADAALGALAIAAAAVAVLPAAADTGTVVDGLYPAGDVLLLVLVAGALALAGRAWSPSWTLLAAAFAAQVVADGGYLLAGDRYVAGGAADIGWTASALLVALAAARSRNEAPAGASRWSELWTSTTFGAIAVAVQVADHFVVVPVAAVLLSAGALLVLLLRVGLLFEANADLLQQRADEARCDPLTGLGNRRALLEALEATTTPHRLAVYDLDGFKAYNDAFGHPAGDALLRRLAERLARFAVPERARAFRLGGDEFCLLVPAGPAVGEVLAGAATAMGETGEGFTIGASGGSAPFPHPGGPSGALGEADTAMYAVKRGGRRTAARQSGDVLEAALRERHPDLAEHDSGVAQLAGALARALGLDTTAAEQVREAGRLHDIGKIAIPDAILGKPGQLDADEWAFVREHTLIGERILMAAPDLAPVAPMVRCSHERWDGTGYPSGLAGEAIPLGARIVAACDAYDAMVSERPYQPRRSDDVAVRELRRCAGSQFDPRVVAALCELLAGRSVVS